MKKVAFHTFGCRTNQEETSGFIASFKNLGYDTVKNLADADTIIVNSCSVTGNTETKVRRFINSLSVKYPKAKIVVTGCMAQQLPKELENNKSVDLIIGNGIKKDLPNLVAEGASGLFVEELGLDSIIATPDIIESPKKSRKTRFSLKIQEGCNQICSYCIVPALRGPSRSISLDNVLATTQKAVNLGYREIVLTGTHIGQFKDSDTNFIGLIEKILSLSNSIRVRLSSMNPVDCTEKLFEYMVKEPRICRHLHISMQSLSPKVLKDMHRSPRAMELLQPRIEKYLDIMPELSYGADIIVGFPTETEDDFNYTLNSIEKYHLSYGHIFKYSPRPGTEADTLEDAISSSEKDKRSLLIRDRIKELKDQFMLNRIGSTVEVISEEDGILKGLSSNYLKVVDKTLTQCRKNEIYTVKIDDYNNDKLSISLVK